MRRNQEIKENYLEWLYFKVLMGPNTRYKAFKRLYLALLDSEYIPLHPMDKNRFKDGLEMREEYIYEYGGNYDDLLGCTDDILPNCSVLEMLIALSVRIEKDIMAPADGENDYFRWFWGMICTLELDEFDEKHFDLGWISKIIDEFLTGKKCIFNVRKCNNHGKPMQIWDQMNQYLMENW